MMRRGGKKKKGYALLSSALRRSRLTGFGR